MKIKLYSIALAILASSAVMAQDSTTTKTTTVRPDGSSQTKVETTTGSGTLTEYVPGSTFILKETSGPVTYTYGKQVAYVTRGGQVISENDMKTRIRVGVPVSVQYVTEGSNRVISRVVVDD